MIIDVDGVAVEVTRKKIKSLRLAVHAPDGRVTLSVPYGVSDRAALALVKSKLGWIKRQRDKVLSAPKKLPRRYESGETLTFFGREYELCRAHGRYNLDFCEDKATLTAPKTSTVAQCHAFVKEQYRKLLAQKISAVLPAWEQYTGLKCSSWQIKDMKTRWGSCNTRTNKIYLALNLAKLPEFCLDYVIVHELVHTREANHGAGFYALMDKYMPSWRQTKNYMNSAVTDRYEFKDNSYQF